MELLKDNFESMSKSKLILTISLIASTTLISSCTKHFDPGFNSKDVDIIEDNYRNYYEIFVGSYVDSNGDGMGDLNGVTSKLDYIQDLGFTGIWLMPINKSSSYHKYNVDGYFTIDANYGTMEDFENLVKEAHKRNINVIIDLVLNHSGINNEWFKKSATAKAKELNGRTLTEEDIKFKDLYSFSEISLSGYSKVPNYNFYYECNFSQDMPEFNWDSTYFEELWHEIVDFYLDKGVDGFRLDAVKYYYYGNDTKNIEALSKFNSYVKAKNPNAYIVGENWSDVGSIKNYYDSGIDSFFAFQTASASGDGGFIKDSLYYQGYPEKYLTSLLELEEISSKGIAAPFLDNHDMGRIWLSTQPNWNKYMYGLLAMLSGTTFTYYGDEISMTGSVNPDQNVRNHMNWGDSSIETNDPIGTTVSNYPYPSVNEQLNDANSQLNYVKKANYLRNTIEEIARGKSSEIVLDSENHNLAIKKEYDGSEIGIFFNFNENLSTNFDVSSLGYSEIIGELNMEYFNKAKLENNILTLLPYGIAIMK